MGTLWGYHALGCDLAHTAGALSNHRSTVRYRLYRVREVTGIEPEDPRSMEALLEIAGLHA
ncbi:helix-turn-helix domain-containing protein [Pseudonocardia zijingensis]|jgi:sugar diacid utilization regulator|uniref:helix-turn-helix domain-containing protein n=1 Tax=Pseudonocardia zijingensis TaxID=153376 RepID=UPI00360FECAF